MTVRGVLLDIDDTLVDTRAAFRVAMGHVVTTWLPQRTAVDDALRHWAADPSGTFRAYTRGELTFAEQRRRRAEQLHAAFGGPQLDDDVYLEWDDGYEAAFRGAWRALPDGVALVAALGELGVPFGALTNMEAAYQRDKLRAVGLAVPLLVSVDDLGRGKPDPAVFRLGCERLGLAPDEVVYVGDELDVDARGARDAGLLGVWVDRHGVGTAPSDVPWITRLTQLPDVAGLVPTTR
jgi:putative hydrolase of the HAD superfamily